MSGGDGEDLLNFKNFWSLLHPIMDRVVTHATLERVEAGSS